MQNKKRLKEDPSYGNRRPAEIAISTFERVLGENVPAGVWCNVIRETGLKVMICNLMIDDAMEREMSRDQAAGNIF